MTVLVPKVAGVDPVLACAPPRRGGAVHPAMSTPPTSAAPTRLLARRRAGARGDGVRARGRRPGRHDRRRRQRLRHRGQAPAVRPRRHRPARRAVGDHRDRRRRGRRGARRRRPAGPGRARSDLTRRADLPPRTSARAVRSEAERQLDELGDDTRARRLADYGAVDRRGATARRPSRSPTSVAPEHLEVHAADEDLVARPPAQLRLAVPRRAPTVAFSDKGTTGTNHVLPTGRAARYSGGLWVALRQDAHLPAHRP